MTENSCDTPNDLCTSIFFHFRNPLFVNFIPPVEMPGYSCELHSDLSLYFRTMHTNHHCGVNNQWVKLCWCCAYPLYSRIASWQHQLLYFIRLQDFAGFLKLLICTQQASPRRLEAGLTCWNNSLWILLCAVQAETPIAAWQRAKP